MAVKPPDPGIFDKRIEIQANAYTRDDHGGKTDVWTTLATVYAAILPLRGREFIAAQAVQSELTHRVRMHFRRGMRADFRLKYGVRIFNIISIVNPEEADVYLDVMCKELKV